MNNTKELKMNKIKTIGVSALCGTLAAVSAQAGELSVSGSANATYTTKPGFVTGAPLGITSAMAFTGTGELDNGNAVAVHIYHDDQNIFSSADISVDVAGIGKFTVDQGTGTGLHRLDDKTPTAWEEPYDAGLDSGIVKASGVGGGTDIELAVSGDLTPEGMSLYVSYAPTASAGVQNDKTTSGRSDLGSGYDIVVEHSGLADGLNIFGGYSDIDDTRGNDRKAKVIGFTYAVGMVTIGAQKFKDEMGATGVDSYENVAFGVSFLVNDNLSLSYGQHKSAKDMGGAAVDVDLKATSVQAAYTMGGATFKIARSDIDNASYNAKAEASYDVNVVAMSLAF